MSASFVFRADEKTGNSMTLDCFVRIPSQTIQSPYPSAPSLSSAHEIHPIFIVTEMLHTIIQKSDVPQDRLQILVLHKYQHLFPLCVAPVAHLIKDNLPRSPSFISNDHNDPFPPNTGTSLPSSTSTVMSDSMSALSLDCPTMPIDQWLCMGLLAHTVAGDVKFNLETWADPLFERFDNLHAVRTMPIKASMRKLHVRIALLSKSKECSKKLTEYLGRAWDLNVEPTSVCISNWIMDADQNWESKRDLWYIAQVYALKLKSQD